MTTAMSSDGGGVRALRALTAVVALYALVLQAVLGGAVALSFGPSFDVRCLDQADGVEQRDPATPHGPAHQHSCCCTAAHPAAGTPPPLPVAAGFAWPHRLAVRLVWRMEGDVSARAPPRTPAHARAPPVA